MNGKILLIANPVAGHGHTRQRLRKFIRIAHQQGCQVKTYLTTCAGDAQRRAGRIGSDVDILVVAGGDGTLNEVINGLSDPSRIPILLLPSGTSNVLANELGIPLKPEAVAHSLAQGNIRRIDMGLIGDRRFTVFVNAGIDSMVTKEVLQAQKNSIGYWRYFLPVLRVISYYREPRLRITVDGKKGPEGALVHVSNIRNYGGIFVISDLARCDSGHLDVCIFPKATFPALIRYYFAASRGRVSKLKDVHYLTGKQVFIESEEPVPVQTDGEHYGMTPVTIELRPSLVPIIVPDKKP